MSYCKFSKELPITKEYDVVVVGAGPAGLSAAVSSARMGAKTALIEKLGVVGGAFIAGHVGPLMGGVSKGTIVEEIHKLLGTYFWGPMHDIEKGKISLLHWLNEEDVDLYLQTPVVDLIQQDGIISGLVVSTKMGLELFKAKQVIDATGDGMIAYLAGADYSIGRDEDGLVQPVTLMFTLTNVNTEVAVICKAEESEAEINGKNFVEFCKEKCAQGELPENVSIIRLYPSVNAGEIMVNATQENYIDGLNYNDMTKAEINLRKQIETITNFLIKYVPGYENCYVKDSADVLGIRETRRIKGDYTLNDLDLLSGRRFEDVMVHEASFVIDIHNPDGGGQAEGYATHVQPYDIPYRCFLPCGLNNLMTAGRCISGTHRAHASYRVMNICMAMGQTVGIAAALSAKHGVTPRELGYQAVQKELITLGVELVDC